MNRTLLVDVRIQRVLSLVSTMRIRHDTGKLPQWREPQTLVCILSADRAGQAGDVSYECNIDEPNSLKTGHVILNTIYS